MSRRFNRPGAVAIVTLGVAMAASTALAQTQPAAPQQAPTQGSATQPSTGPTPNDTELKHFAQAVVDVQNIKNSLQPELASAKTPDDRTKLKQAAEQKMEAVVRSHQLSVQRYVQIAEVVQQDSAIRAKVQQYMQPQPQSSTKS